MSVLTIDDLLAMLAGEPALQRDLLRKWLDKTDEEREAHLAFVQAERVRIAKELHRQLGLTDRETVVCGPRRATLFGRDADELLASEALLPEDRERGRRWLDAYLKDGKQLHQLGLDDADRAATRRIATVAAR